MIDTQLQQNSTDVLEIWNEAWTYDEPRSKRWKKPIYVSTINKVDNYGMFDPWYEELPKNCTFWHRSKECDEITCISHKTKNPNGEQVGLVVLNLSVEVE